MTGYALCTTCESKLTEVFRTRWESATGFAEHIHAFAWTAVAVLSSPRAFFTTMMPRGSWLKPAVFGLIAYSLGTYASVLWSWAFVAEFQSLLADYAARAQMPPDAAFLAILLALPFAAPLALGAHAMLLHFANRVVGGDSDWRLIVRIASFASAAYLFQIIPPISGFPIGYMLAIIWLMNVEMIAIQHFFKLGVWKAMAVVFVPFMLLMALGI